MKISSCANPSVEGGLMNPLFVYVRHEMSDIRVRFQRVRAELAAPRTVLLLESAKK
jgi:hypothetical protein